MHKTKFNSFPKEDQETIINDEDIQYREVKITDPNNTGKVNFEGFKKVIQKGIENMKKAGKL